MRRPLLSALALVTSLTVVGPSRAGCCDDFWSCLGAVASAGVSCQIQGLIDTVNAMKTLVETVTNDLRTRTGDIIAQAQKGVSDAAADAKRVREQSMADLTNAANRAHQAANPPNKGLVVNPAVAAPMGHPAGGVAAAPALGQQHVVAGAVNVPAGPKAADAKAVSDALTRADSYVKDLREKANAPHTDVANAEQAALAAALRHVALAQRIGLEIAIAPLNALRDSLVDLLTHPERIFDPSAQIEADIQRISQQVPALFDQIANEVTQEAMGNLNGAKDKLQILQDSAASAVAVADAMQKASSTHLQTDLDALDRLVPKAPPSSAHVFPMGIAGNHQLIAVAFTHTDPAKLPVIIQRRAAIGDIAAHWQGIKARAKIAATVEPASTQKVDHDLAQKFAGKSKGDIDKAKGELLEEAKKRFAKDPKTLDKVQKYIEAHAKG